MKAWVLHQVGCLEYEDIHTPSLQDHEVLVKVKASGICGSDVPRIYQTGTYSYPLIPGHEFSGVVTELGTGADKGWLNRRVGIFPLIPCGLCGPCRHSQYEMCRRYSYLGSRRNGGFAEYVAVPQWNLMCLPDRVSFSEAAMLEPMAVAVHAMRRARPDASGTTVICGLGTIGLLLFLFLREAGMKNILAIGNKDFQKEAALGQGLAEDCFCDSRNQDAGRWILDRTDGNGADVFFECVGKNETYSLAIANTAPAGKVLLMGNPHSSMNLEKDIYWKILRNQLAVTGTWNSSFTHSPEDDWHYVLERLADGRISPGALITHEFPLGKLVWGMELMRDKTEDYIKVMGIFH